MLEVHAGGWYIDSTTTRRGAWLLEPHLPPPRERLCVLRGLVKLRLTQGSDLLGEAKDPIWVVARELMEAPFARGRLLFPSSSCMATICDVRKVELTLFKGGLETRPTHPPMAWRARTHRIPNDVALADIFWADELPAVVEEPDGNEW